MGKAQEGKEEVEVKVESKRDRKRKPRKIK